MTNSDLFVIVIIDINDNKMLTLNINYQQIYHILIKVDEIES